MSRYTVIDVARECGVKRETVYRWIQRGHLKGVSVGKGITAHWEFEEEEVKKFITGDHYIGFPEDILTDRPFNRVPELEDCYPVNLLINLLKIDDDSGEDIWDYNIGKFRDLINLLPERYQKVLQLRYKFGLTLDEVGKTMNLTRERIRMIQLKAEKKLKRICACKGIRIVNKEDHAKLLVEYKALQTLCSDLKAQLNSYRGVSEDEEKKQPDIGNVPIEEMDFSVRIYNCLKRAYIGTLEDIIYFDQHQGELSEKHRYLSWLHIRNFGARSIREFAKRVFDYSGYRLHQWDSKSKSYTGLIPITKAEEMVPGGVEYYAGGE